MKRLLLLLALGAALGCPALAQSTDTSNTPPPGPPPDDGPRGWHGGNLTEEERQELRAAHEAAIQANPDLATEEKQLREQMKALQEKIKAAMIKADPKVEPILAKMEAGHEHHEGPPPGQ